MDNQYAGLAALRASQIPAQPKVEEPKAQLFEINPQVLDQYVAAVAEPKVVAPKVTAPRDPNKDFWKLPDGLRDMIVYMMTSPTLQINGTPVSEMNTVSFQDETFCSDLFKNFVDHCKREAAFYPQVMTREDTLQYCKTHNIDVPHMIVINRSDFEGSQFDLKNGEELYRRYFNVGGVFTGPGPWLIKLGLAFAVCFLIMFLFTFPFTRALQDGPKYVFRTFGGLFLIQILAAVMVTVAGAMMGSFDGLNLPTQWKGSYFKRQPFWIMMLYSLVIALGLLFLFSPLKTIATILWVLFGITF